MDKLTISQDHERSRKSSIVSQENIKPSPYMLSEQNVAILANAYSGAPSTTVSSQIAEDDVPENEVGGGGAVGGGWITQPRKGREVPGTAGAGFVGYDPNGVAHARVRAPSTIVSSVEPTAHANMKAPNPFTKPVTKEESTRRARWAKVKVLSSKNITFLGSELTVFG